MSENTSRQILAEKCRIIYARSFVKNFIIIYRNLIITAIIQPCVVKTSVCASYNTNTNKIVILISSATCYCVEILES